MKFISLKNVCLYLVLVIQICFAIICTLYFCHSISNYFETKNYILSNGFSLDTWDSSRYTDDIVMFFIGILSCIFGAIVTVSFFIRINFTEFSNLTNKQHKEKRQEKKAEKQKKKAEKLEKRLNALKKDT